MQRDAVMLNATPASLMHAALDAQAMAIALHGPDGRAAFLNRAMQRLLRADEKALSAHAVLGMAPLDAGHRRRFMSLLQEALRGVAGEMPLPRGEGPPPYLISLLPLEGQGVMVTVLDAARRRLPSHAFLREAFAFTPAEAALALDLADGLAAADCASLRGVSVHTVRSQLRSLFGKTGTSRQAELVTLVLAMGLRQAPGGAAE